MERTAGEGIDQLREDLERAASSVLGDETKALARALAELNELERVLDDEMRRNGQGRRAEQQGSRAEQQGSRAEQQGSRAEQQGRPSEDRSDSSNPSDPNEQGSDRRNENRDGADQPSGRSRQQGENEPPGQGSRAEEQRQRQQQERRPQDQPEGETSNPVKDHAPKNNSQANRATHSEDEANNQATTNPPIRARNPTGHRDQDNSGPGNRNSSRDNNKANNKANSRAKVCGGMSNETHERINEVGRKADSLPIAPTGSPRRRRSRVRVFVNGPIDCAMWRKWLRIQSFEAKRLAFATGPGRCGSKCGVIRSSRNGRWWKT